MYRFVTVQRITCALKGFFWTQKIAQGIRLEYHTEELGANPLQGMRHTLTHSFHTQGQCKEAYWHVLQRRKEIR